MTEVLLVGEESLREELFAYENARRALSAYELREPYRNALALDTVSLGAAVSLLNDLDWYLARATDDAAIKEPSVDSSVYLSRDLAAAVRDERGEVGESERVRVYESEDGLLVNPETYPRGEAPAGALSIRI